MNEWEPRPVATDLARKCLMNEYDRLDRKYPLKALIGRRFGQLVVEHFARRSYGGRSEGCLACRCDCGQTILVKVSHLMNGINRSCRSCWKRGLKKVQ